MQGTRKKVRIYVNCIFKKLILGQSCKNIDFLKHVDPPLTVDLGIVLSWYTNLSHMYI